MKRHWLPMLTLAAFVSLGACGEAGQQEAAGGAEAARTAATDTAPEDTAKRAAKKQVSLAAKSESGITGTASFAKKGDSLAVKVSLSGLKEGASYPAHIHQGSCAQGGPVAAALTSVTGEAGGSGKSESVVAKGSLQDTASYFVQAHLPDGTPAACGNVPSHDGGEKSGGAGYGGGSSGSS